MDSSRESTAKLRGDAWLTTGEMARLSQTTLRTVRFYEAEGLIRSELREDGTHRKFAASELQKLQIIADLRESGLSLQEIKDLMALKRGQGGAEDAACAMSSALCAQVQDLDRRVATLNRVRGELASMINMLEECRVCTSPTFPAACATCDRAKQPDAERATQLFWKH